MNACNFAKSSASHKFCKITKSLGIKTTKVGLENCLSLLRPAYIRLFLNTALKRSFLTVGDLTVCTAGL